MKDITLKTAQRRQQALNETKYIGSSIWEAMIVGKGAWQGDRWNKSLIIEQAYQRNAPFYSAVNMITNMAASLPIEVETDVRGKRSRTSNHPLINMLNRNEPVRDFVKRLLSYYIVTGETFAEIVMNSVNSQPLGLIVMPSQFCKKIQGTRFNPINAIKYLEKGQEVEIPYNKVVHIFNPSLSNYFEELSPAIPLQEIISLNNSAITWNKNVAQSGGLPPFVVKAMGANKAQAQKIREEWMAQSGAKNSHLLKIISENMDIQKMNDSPHDAEWSQAVTSTMRMIFMVLGMSSSLQNDAANKTYNNYHEARKSMYMENIIPLVELMLGAINRKLQMYYDDNPSLVVSREKIEAIQEERGQMIDRLVKAVDAGIITANEARKELALNPAKGATADILQNSRIINNIPKVDINNQDDTDITTNTNDADENEG